MPESVDPALLHLIRSMGLHAQNAYLTGLDLRRTLVEFPAVGLFQSDLGYLADSGEQLIIAFAGPREGGPAVLDAWSGDAARLADHSAGRVHAGLQRQMRFSIRDDLLRGLEKLNTGQAILITGHSTGGALATLASYELQREGFLQVAAFTFGSPKVGDAAFAMACRFPVYRIECAGDPMPRLPDSNEYSAIGECVRLGENGDTGTAQEGGSMPENYAMASYLDRLQNGT